MMKRVAVPLLLLFAAIHAQQDTGTWVSLSGPLGGLGYNVAQRSGNPSILLVTDAWAGVHKSTNGGATWNASNTGITARTGATRDAIPVFSLAIDPNDNDIVWAGTQNGGGLFRSTNGGDTWTRRDSGIAFFPLESDPQLGLTIRHITVQPGNSGVVYVAGEFPTGVMGIGFERVRGFVYKSEDGGATFAPAGEFASLARWLFVDPAQPGNLLLATGIFDREADTDDAGDTLPSGPGLGVFRSTDGGASWQASNNGFTPGRSLFVGGAARHPTDPAVFIVATGNNSDAEVRNAHGAVYKSTDGGVNWTGITPPLPLDVDYEVYAAAAFAPSNPQIVYVGTSATIYRSTNQGADWTAHRAEGGDAPWGPPGVRSGVPIDMIVDAANPDIVYVNNYGGGMVRTTNGGQTWHAWSVGFTGADLRGLSVKPGTGGTDIAVNGRSGPFQTSAQGAAWHGLAFGQMAWFPEGAAIAHDPSDAAGNTLLATDELSGVILRSTNGGGAWTQVVNMEDSLLTGGPGKTHGVRSIVFAPSTPSIVYAGFLASGLNADPHERNYPESFGVYRSPDGGQTWAPRSNGLPTGARARNVTGIAVSRQNPDKLYVALRDGGVYRSVNGGQNWTAAMGALPATESWEDVWAPQDPLPRHFILSVDVHPDDDETIAIGTGIFGVYRSSNGGQSWSSALSATDMIYQGMSDQAHVMAVRFDPSDASRLYAADWHGGVYASADSGSTWRQINEGLSMRSVNTLAITGDGAWLYAATQGGGAYRYRAKQGTPTGVRDRRSVPPGPRLGQNSPNPFRGGTVIPFALTQADHVRIEVRDRNGRLVAVPVNDRYPAGPHHAAFDAAKLAPGRYFYRLETPGNPARTRMLTVR